MLRREGVMPRSFELRRDEPLAPHTSLHIGGPAEYFVSAQTAEALVEALDWAAACSLPVTVLGGGSNVVVSDDGVPGLVVQPAIMGERLEQQGDVVTLRAGAGTLWDELVASTVHRGFAGLECLSGIPGHVGATPIQNVGAYGQEIAGALASVEVYDRERRERRELGREECELGYRTSRFKAREPGRFIVLSVTFTLRAGGAPCVAYPEIARALSVRGAAPPSVAEARDAVLATRRKKSMVIERGDENARSCGSFFLNPELDPEPYRALAERLGEAPPSFELPHGRRKVPAAWLIERAGLRRGQRWDAVGISTKHSLALVCHEGATARALVAAAHAVREQVGSRLGVWLEPEPVFLGFGAAGLPPPP